MPKFKKSLQKIGLFSMKLFADNKGSNYFNSKNQAHWNCPLHQGQRITNFCMSEQCLLPLCPQCVKAHSQDHSKMNLHGNFEVIQTVISNVRNELNKKLDRSQKMKNIVESLNKNKSHELSEIVSSLRGFRAELISVINEHFRNLEEQIKENISVSQQKFNEQIQRNMNISRNLTENAKKALDSLNGTGCMEAVVNTFTDLKKKQTMLDDSCKKIQQAAQIKNIVNLNRTYINEIIDQINLGVEVTTVELPEFQLSNSVLHSINHQRQAQSKYNSVKSSMVRQGLVEINKNQGDDFYNNQKIEMRVQEGLIDRLSKTTQKLQNDLEAIRKAQLENRPVY